MDWRDIEWGDIPTRDEFEQLTLDLLRRGVTNSERMRDEIRRARKLKLKQVTGNRWDTPSGKFVNEHAWALEELVLRKAIEKTGKMEYRLSSQLCGPELKTR